MSVSDSVDLNADVIPPPGKHELGLFRKYEVKRVDGKTDDPSTVYFVLRIGPKTDPNALPAIKAYAKACKKDYPVLEQDMSIWIDWMQERLAQQKSDQTK